ncbi:hypothetical protein BEWA_002520 [Theileria equi strain WA]|uniref:SP-RING-type domain-containing protein n=1 Tax=Theileria equi strain WA TaxID=1537102 RepID=L0AZ59_THEEQ|nr:hypothetical protein BEWA_002520 [Theileria equi strain WA]AFZ80845.1 hypothetical protein BEWA_002520 [Theileria equi strain WA]|eukprot:XP_004830511.1 hypothetical protein BEWA_002520 [Theileria equi strain WA]
MSNELSVNEFGEELYGMTQAWSKYNDNIYLIANQLLSLVFSFKFFGNQETCEKLHKLCEAFFKELDELGDRLEDRKNFSFDRVYQTLMDVLVVNNKTESTDDVLVEESKSDFCNICPITRKPIVQPVSQVLSDGGDSCSHIFDHTAIMHLLKSTPEIHCPIAACTKNVHKDRLHRDWESIHWKRHHQFQRICDEITQNLDQEGEKALYLI